MNLISIEQVKFKPITIKFSIDTETELKEFIEDLGVCHGRVTNVLYNAILNLNIPCSSHESALKMLVLGFAEGSGKIPAIKAVRQYCSEHKYDKYYGLREAKEYVESLRSNRFWRGYPIAGEVY